MRFKTTYGFLLLLFYCQFSDAQYAINGDAIQLGDDCFQLTPALNFHSGSVWSLQTINLQEDFTLDIEMFLGCLDGNGADGIYVAFQPVSTSLGSAGGGLGFEGIVPALGVEFDTWQNNDLIDPTYDHIAIMRDGILNHQTVNNLVGPVPISATTTNVEDCQFHDVKITWNASTQTLEAYYDCDLRVSYTGDIVNDIFGGDPNVFWGFTAATGGSVNVQTVCLNYITFTDELADTTICVGQSTALEVPDIFASYLWLPDIDLNNNTIYNPIATPTATTTYTVELTDSCGFSVYDTVTVFVDPLIDIDLGPDLFFCEGATTVLDATTPNATYLWQDNSTDPTFLVTQEGTYWVHVTDGNCIGGMDTIVVTYDTPVLIVGNEVNTCENEPVQLNSLASVGVTYQWSPTATLDNPNIPNPIATPIATTTYTVVVTNADGCTNSDAITVTMNALIADAGVDETICEGEEVQLNVSPNVGMTYEWSPVAGLSATDIGNPLASPSSTTTYTVTVTDGGCQDIDEVTITVIPLPDAAFDPDMDSLYCASDDIVPLFPHTPGGTMTGEGVFGMWAWSPRFVTTLDEPIDIVYTVTVNGCTHADTQTVMVLTPPDPSFAIQPTYWATDPPDELIPNTPGGVFFGAGVTGNMFIPSIIPPVIYGMPLEITYHVEDEACTGTLTQGVTVYPCVMPDSLFVTNLSATGATLNWNTVPNGVNYLLKYKPISASTWTTVEAEGNSYTLNGLMSGLEYEFQVATKCGATNSEFTGSETLTNPAVGVAIKVFLEGPYNSETGLMNTDLKNGNLVPLVQPYNREPWYYEGDESVGSLLAIPENIVDWVMLETRAAADNTIILEKRAAFVREDGIVVSYLDFSSSPTFLNLQSGAAYYMVVRHRNHLAVLSAEAVTVVGAALSYDFTTDVNQALGIAQLKNLGDGFFGLYAGDFNSDGVMTTLDFNIYTAQSSILNMYLDGDANLDRAVTIGDFNLFQGNSSKIGVTQIRY